MIIRSCGHQHCLVNAQENDRMQLITILIIGVLSCAAEHVAAGIDPADSRIYYTGRWDSSDPSEPRCTWQGSSITARFSGTAIRAEFDSGSRPEYIRVIIDGNAAKSRKLKLTPRQQTYTLAAGLDPSEHQIEIIKETYTGKGRLTFYGFLDDFNLMFTRMWCWMP